ncbi:O-succinylhomoserine sulfhydrylase [Chromohalobacter canadensis]|uniref:O-succinylhomoserine sulfhydrylase n=1 Tax=Chromohalobacter canadensis TaxID=141389 RepID=A0ABZ0YAG5_9GAMM|nr:O-succinylhomoserine sulfhydrylase [Chromohalobacter canadensis]MCK0768017.1 O-succinylhomoserine sulfhydrylase [Chromohalobacter canadensis]MCT8467723.1 O-succinylhomoserine sulfhydrylase [Chromohalobacter canadensis]MCT8470529.1 O-succinylhomoserine sulfhydrylase [Chromohalobacter canadensis]MCT8498220.1 O-succinylhomoserine sulfhydrylase [Chromohalobacter canadensis]WQH08584.1 O-succinylhomoserine sulfhydrylase [Chromohalobacter canadensis]
MHDDHDDTFALDTLAIRAGHDRTHEQEHGEPIFPTSSFVYGSAAEAARKFSGEEPGNIYSRFTNPTVRTFEQRLAALEGGEQCVATSSGMAAILATALAFLQAGDEIVASRSLFGSTVSLFDKYLGKLGIVTRYVELGDLDAWQAAITPKTRLLFAETPSNPLSEVVDITALAELAHRHDAWLAIDNCFLTPVLQRPLDLGADLVIHSATKYLDGQGRAIGGAVVGPEEMLKELVGVVRTCGPCMSPFNAWIFLKGLETLGLRMKAHCENTLALAQWLEAQPEIARVHYSGLESHPQHTLAKQQQNGFGAVLGVEVKGGRDGAWALIDHSRLMSITGNLGDVKTTVTHPATTTHARLSDEQKAAAGISEGLVRIAVGLEALDDLKRDIRRGLDTLG